jgi:hypothetical protein
MTDQTWSECASLNTCEQDLVLRSQIRTLLSEEQVAKLVPSGDIETPKTQEEWPDMLPTTWNSVLEEKLDF